MRKLLYRESDGEILNVIELEDGADWQPSEGQALLDDQPGANIGDTWDGEQIVKREPEPPPPDPDGAVMAGIDLLGRRRANQLLRAYPVFLNALERRNWTVARETLNDGLADGALTQQEYDTLTQLLDDHNIPQEGRG